MFCFDKLEFVLQISDAPMKAPSDEGAVSEADWGREKMRICNIYLSLRPCGPPPSLEGGRALPRHSKEMTNCILLSQSRKQPL